MIDFCEPCWDNLDPKKKHEDRIERDRQEDIDFFDELEDALMAIRQQIRYKFPNFNSILEIDAMMQNMIYTNELLAKVQDWVRK